MERPRYEADPTVIDINAAYEQNHAMLLDLMGRINSRLSANYRADRPRSSEHIGSQEELLAALVGVVDYLGA